MLGYGQVHGTQLVGFGKRYHAACRTLVLYLGNSWLDLGGILGILSFKWPRKERSRRRDNSVLLRFLFRDDTQYGVCARQPHVLIKPENNTHILHTLYKINSSYQSNTGNANTSSQDKLANPISWKVRGEGRIPTDRECIRLHAQTDDPISLKVHTGVVNSIVLTCSNSDLLLHH